MRLRPTGRSAIRAAFTSRSTSLWIEVRGALMRRDRAVRLNSWSGCSSSRARISACAWLRKIGSSAGASLLIDGIYLPFKGRSIPVVTVKERSRPPPDPYIILLDSTPASPRRRGLAVTPACPGPVAWTARGAISGRSIESVREDILGRQVAGSDVLRQLDCEVGGRRS